MTNRMGHSFQINVCQREAEPTTRFIFGYLLQEDSDFYLFQFHFSMPIGSSINPESSEWPPGPNYLI